MKKKYLIKYFSKEKDFMKIIWDDGKVSKFHFIWLRDNCSSNEHPDARQKIFNIIDVSKNIHPIKYNINKNGNLEIDWSEDNHHSCYDAKWLKKHCYTQKNNCNFIYFVNTNFKIT